MITINPKRIIENIHWVYNLTIKYALDKVKKLDDALSYRAPNEGHQPTVSISSQPPNIRSGVQSNNTVYGLKLYMTLEDLNKYIHDNVDGAYKNHTFIPVKAEFNEHSMEIEINLLSANPLDADELRYKLDPNRLGTTPKPDTKPCNDCLNDCCDTSQCQECSAENNFKNFIRW